MFILSRKYITTIAWMQYSCCSGGTLNTLSGHRTLLLLSILFFGVLTILIPTREANAALMCYDCHGTKPPATADFRPLDTTWRDAATGGFKGNHRNHMAQTTNAAACAKCHPGSDHYTPSHRDGEIKLSSRLNNSPSTTRYPSYKTIHLPGSRQQPPILERAPM